MRVFHLFFNWKFRKIAKFKELVTAGTFVVLGSCTYCSQPVFSIGITLVDIPLKRLYWFYLLIVSGDSLILMDFLIFPLPFLDVVRFCLCNQFFSRTARLWTASLAQLDSGVLCPQIAYSDLNRFKTRVSSIFLSMGSS